jgi:hypothetical protein
LWFLGDSLNSLWEGLGLGHLGGKRGEVFFEEGMIFEGRVFSDID